MPGWFAPVRIGDSRNVDGGAPALINLSSVVAADVDLAIVSAPMGRSGRRGGFSAGADPGDVPGRPGPGGRGPGAGGALDLGAYRLRQVGDLLGEQIREEPDPARPGFLD